MMTTRSGASRSRYYWSATVLISWLFYGSISYDSVHAAFIAPVVVDSCRPHSYSSSNREEQNRDYSSCVSHSSTRHLLYSTTHTSAAAATSGTKSTTSTESSAGGSTKKKSTVYPTQRGTTVDSRQIIVNSEGRRHIQEVLIRHILFATEALAEDSLLRLRTAEIGFEELAKSVSACAETRDEGGTVGWVHVQQQQQQADDPYQEEPPRPPRNGLAVEQQESEEDTVRKIAVTDKNEHLDGIFPPDARRMLNNLVTKPGDIVLIPSSRGYHLVQVVDVMANVRQMATQVRRRSRSRSLNRQQAPSNRSFQDLTYKMETMGCQMNQADSERMEGQLAHLGIQPHNGNVIDAKEADVIILNTCSIRDHAEQKVYSYLGPYAKRKRNGEDVTIIVAGCVAQQEGQDLLRRAPEIDLVMGPQFANRLGDLLEDVHNGNQVVATAATHIMEDVTKPRRNSQVAAWVNVIYGCNERCTFCIVPTTRGVEQSRPVESIVAEVTGLVQKHNYKEVTLLGQNIDAYGRDMVPKRKFSDLIRIIGSIPGLERLRFVTSHPRYMSMGVVDAVAETPAACESFHIPFQSGSNDILATMGRGHTREKYLRIVDRIRSRIPDASITADVIVGFPGETEQDFQQTLDLMETVVFDSVNTAAYSPRPNTPAATWTNQVDDAVKQDRLARINQLNKEHATQRRARMLGRTVPVLIEERNVRTPTQVMGRTRHGYIVYCEGDIDLLRGQTVNVQIEKTEAYHLAGTILP